MRKLPLLSIVLIFPALGCECVSEPLRRLEVWKQQTLFAPPPAVVTAPLGAVCGPAPTAECGCGIAAETGCGQAGAVPAVTSYGPETVISDTPADSTNDTAMPGPVLTEESDGVLKQP